MIEVNEDDIQKLYRTLNEEAEASGYHLHPDREFTEYLVKGLIVNEKRYGYRACPCRLASGVKAEDLDIICPCDYRDADLNEYDQCYCGLYVTEKILKGEKRAGSIPERRGQPVKDVKVIGGEGAELSGLSYPVWRCRVCGYLCARDEPPEVCPICKASKERFERFI